MRDSDRYSNFLKRPHPAGRLAFLAEGVRILQAHDDSRPGIYDRSELRNAVARRHREELLAEWKNLGFLQPGVEDLPPNVEAYLANAVAERLYLEALDYERWVASLPDPRKPPKPPAELKPEKTIVAMLCLVRRAQSQPKSERAFYAEIAEFLNKGVPTGTPGLLLDHVRRADREYWKTESDHVDRRRRQLRVRDARHPWERDYAETIQCLPWSLSGKQLLTPTAAAEIIWLKFGLYIRALLFLEQQAKHDGRFKHLRGAELAKRIDAVSPSRLDGCVGRALDRGWAA